MSGSYVSQFESGTLRRLGAERLSRIATALGVSLDEVIGGGDVVVGDADSVGSSAASTRRTAISREEQAVERSLGIIDDELSAIAALDAQRVGYYSQGTKATAR